MKHLLMTTALVAFTALPVTAQTNTQTQSGQATSPEQAQMQNQDQLTLGETFQASDLIGKRLYMPAGDGAGMQGQTGSSSQTGNMTQNQDQSAVQDNAQTGATTDTQDSAQSDAQSRVQDGETDLTANVGQNRDGQRNEWQMIGQVTDVILSTDGQAEGLIVDSGGFMGMNANQLRVAIADVRFVPEDQIQQGAQQRTEPVVDNADNNNTEAQTDFSVIYTGDRSAFEQAQPYDQEQSTQAGEQLGSTTWDQPDRQQQQVTISDITTEELIGAPTYGSQNEWLGEVSELALGDNGEVAHVIIDVGGFLGIGEKPVALSMDQIDLRVHDGDELRVYVNYTEDELDAMETWESDTDL